MPPKIHTTETKTKVIHEHEHHKTKHKDDTIASPYQYRDQDLNRYQYQNLNLNLNITPEVEDQVEVVAHQVVEEVTEMGAAGYMDLTMKNGNRLIDAAVNNIIYTVLIW